jgi:hypothetical protein
LLNGRRRFGAIHFPKPAITIIFKIAGLDLLPSLSYLSRNVNDLPNPRDVRLANQGGILLLRFSRSGGYSRNRTIGISRDRIYMGTATNTARDLAGHNV